MHEVGRVHCVDDNHASPQQWIRAYPSKQHKEQGRLNLLKYRYSMFMRHQDLELLRVAVPPPIQGTWVFCCRPLRVGNDAVAVPDVTARGPACILQSTSITD